MTLTQAICDVQKLVEAELARRGNRPGGLSTSGQSLKSHYENTIRPALQALQTAEEE